MINTSENIAQMMNAPARHIEARVELYVGSTSVDNYNKDLIDTFGSDGALKEFTVSRVNEDGKFFGFGICQELKVVLRDKERVINVAKDRILEVAYGVNNEYIYPYPLYRVETVERDEMNNDLTITAYDFLYKAGEHRVSELPIKSYTIKEFVMACSNILGLPVKFPEGNAAFDLDYPEGANFDGTETLRQALDAVAEATQTIYFVNGDWELTFEALDRFAMPALVIDKSMYFELSAKPQKILSSVCHATELGDNIRASSGDGETQYVRNNPFWELRDDITTIVENALAAVDGTTIDQYACTWRGDFRLHIGDRIGIVTKDNGVIVGYVMNDILTYNGGMQEKTSWSFTEHTAETASNPITLGDVVKQTYAKVDKVNKEITLVASESKKYTDEQLEAQAASIKITTDAITQKVESTEKSIEGTNEQVSQLEIRADGIAADVSSTQSMLAGEIDDTNTTIAALKESLNSSVDSLNESMVELSTQVSASITPEDIQFQVKTALSNGVDSVSTTTGYTFDNEGLTIAKTGSEMTTQITEDGMTVYRGSEGVLVANNEGVQAEDLHATTYLIVGGRSRFENFERDGSSRTGCFWIG